MQNFQMEVFEVGIIVCSKQRQLLANVWGSYSAKCMYLCNSICDRQKIFLSLLFKTRAQKKVQFECHVVSRWKLKAFKEKEVYGKYKSRNDFFSLSLFVLFLLWLNGVKMKKKMIR